jgi:hypothetical protein
LGGAWLAVVYAGITEAFPWTATFAEGHHPHRFLGYALLATAALTMVLTAEYWKRVFPGIMIAAVFNSLLEFFYGHAVNNPSVPVSAATAGVHLLVTAGVAILTLTFKSRRLSVVDRAALLAFIGAFLWQAVDHRFAELKMISGGLCILLAWTIDRWRKIGDRRDVHVPTNS